MAETPGTTIGMLCHSGVCLPLDANLAAASLSHMLSDKMLRTINNTKEDIALECQLMRGRLCTRSMNTTSSGKQRVAS